MNANKPMRFWLAAFAVTSLSACNDNERDAAVIAAPVSQTQPDFTQQVATEVNTSNETLEPKNIDAVVIASSEESEPVAVN